MFRRRRKAADFAEEIRAHLLNPDQRVKAIARLGHFKAAHL